MHGEGSQLGEGDLELKIRTYLESRAGLEVRDFADFHVRIKDLQEEVLAGPRGNAALILTIDNVKLAADDFTFKRGSTSRFWALRPRIRTRIRFIYCHCSCSTQYYTS
ncbi:Keratin, type I cytoskeletal 50 kDa GK50 [Takifugu flavidus]|uniref:Keratin, type I cytoskeletal 50 kDa GK50 n=1 Tax=Takifugu flavidus TaxID=433684 RepID=A0A5C6NSN4_9TELE|nr:Keratin, type I cytoskeletal 50 kDa GK50 [Takifugu flavidus]